MPSRLILRGGDDVFVALAPVEVAHLMDRAAAQGDSFMVVPLVPWAGNLARSGWVRPEAVDGLEPVDEEELRAHRRDREEWIEHGGG
jgi:hypothetical protein